METPPTTFNNCASKRVSFIIVTKNRSDYLRRSLEQHRSLIHENDELIVIDGLSSDGTRQVVEEHADIVDMFVSEPDVNAVHALNKGILLARGKYIKQLTDDDVVYAAPMEEAIKVLETHPEIDLLICGGTRQRGDKLFPVYVPPGTNYGNRLEDVFKYGSCAVGFVMKRSLFARIGLFSFNNLDADKEVVLRAIRAGANVKFCRINLFNHPIYPHSITVKKWHEFLESDYRLVRDYYPMDYYYRFRLKKWWSLTLTPWVARKPFLKFVAKGLLRIMAKLSGRRSQDSSEDKGIVWDGGFS